MKSLSQMFALGMAAIAGFFSSAKEAVAALPNDVKVDADGGLLAAKSTKRVDRKHNPAGSKLARMAREGRVGLATLR